MRHDPCYAWCASAPNRSVSPVIVLSHAAAIVSNIGAASNARLALTIRAVLSWSVFAVVAIASQASAIRPRPFSP